MWESNQERTKYVSHAICLFQQKKICVQMKKKSFLCVFVQSIPNFVEATGWFFHQVGLWVNFVRAQTKPTLYQTRNYFKFQNFQFFQWNYRTKKGISMASSVEWKLALSDLIFDFYHMHKECPFAWQIILFFTDQFKRKLARWHETWTDLNVIGFFNSCMVRIKIQ